MRVAHRVNANKAQISPQEVCAEERGGERRENKDSEKKNMKGGWRKETNPESGARHKISRDGLRSMGLARVGCQMRCPKGRIVPLGVPFPGRHALKCMSGLRKSRKTSGGR